MASRARALIAAARRQRCPWHGASCGAHSHGARGPPEYAFEMASSSVRFGRGVSGEVGHDVAHSGAKKVMVVSDARLSALPGGGPLRRVLDSLTAHCSGASVEVYTDIECEPTDSSFQRAIAAARRASPDAFVVVGGGSAIDTAKTMNLYLCHPDAAFLDFVNAPTGKGLPVPNALRPLYALPTTAGTRSETTGVAIFDHEPSNAKTGIASRRIKPTLGLVDPDNTSTMPRGVAVASGFDVLCHALESYTAIPYDERLPRPASPELRPAYQGANPFSDVWSLHALRLLAKYFRRSCADRDDKEANEAMTLAATMAGIGFGNAGVHLAHGCSYAVSGLNRSKFVMDGYDAPFVPHGVSVVLTAPAIFSATAAANAERHAELAAILRGLNPPINVALSSGGPQKRRTSEDSAASAGAALAEQLKIYMQTLGVPDGLGSLGFTSRDVPALVEATLPQRRVLNLAPSEENASAEALARIFENSMKIY